MAFRPKKAERKSHSNSLWVTRYYSTITLNGCSHLSVHQTFATPTQSIHHHHTGNVHCILPVLFLKNVYLYRGVYCFLGRLRLKNWQHNENLLVRWGVADRSTKFHTIWLQPDREAIREGNQIRGFFKTTTCYHIFALISSGICEKKNWMKNRMKGKQQENTAEIEEEITIITLEMRLDGCHLVNAQEIDTSECWYPLLWLQCNSVDRDILEFK